MSDLARATVPSHGALQRIANADWATLRGALDEHGYAIIGGVFERFECEAVRRLYESDVVFRSRIVMARHGFGQGEYRYFDYPLPEVIEAMRQAIYARLRPVAEAWSKALNGQTSYPADLVAFLEHCRRHGQSRPTPLLLKYGPGDYNRLHQDLYGGIQFPLQAAVLLSAPEGEFDGGEFVLTETAPRRQTRVEVVGLKQGDMVIFAVNHRPVRSAKGFARVAMRHGVSTLRRGERYTLGIIFHDAT